MQPNDRDDSSHYAPRPYEQPVQATEAPKQKKGRLATLLLAVFLVLALIAAGVLAWMWQDASDRASEATAADAAKSNQIKKLQSRLTETESASEVAPAEAAAKTDKEQVVELMTAYVHGNKGWEDAKFTVAVSELQAPFARATYSTADFGGPNCILKKADDVWMVLYCAQADSDYTLQLDKIFGVPASIK